MRGCARADPTLSARAYNGGMTTLPSAAVPLPAQLWEWARALLAEALREFRGPAAIARTLAHEARAAIARRLALLEALLMKLLLIEVSRVRPEAPHAGKARSASAPAALRPPRACQNEDPDEPRSWRVRFHLRAPRAPRALTRRGLIPRLRAAPDAARAAAKAKQLARRFEALRCVMADPRRAIAALARRLRALGGGARAYARRIALASSRHGGGPIFAHATVCAHDASFHLPDADTS
jgi:hypothetical protein